MVSARSALAYQRSHGIKLCWVSKWHEPQSSRLCSQSVLGIAAPTKMWKPGDGRVEDQSLVSGRAMEKNRRAEHRDLSEDGGDDERKNERHQHAATLRKNTRGSQTAAGGMRGIVTRTARQSGLERHQLDVEFYPRRCSKSRMKATSASTPASGNAL